MYISIHVNISIIRPSEAADNHRNILKRCDGLLCKIDGVKD